MKPATLELKPSAAMRKALQSAEDFGDPTRHLQGKSAWGAWRATHAALMRRRWLDHNGKITAAGQDALDR
jgi:hypothetical protein